jgi:hypothetical protein
MFSQHFGEFLWVRLDITLQDVFEAFKASGKLKSVSARLSSNETTRQRVLE